MHTAKEIWEAGRKALGMPGAQEAAAPASAPVVLVPDLVDAPFDPSGFDFEPRTYRVHFKNGNSGEYEGAALATAFPFDPAQIERIEPVEEVGQE